MQRAEENYLLPRARGKTPQDAQGSSGSWFTTKQSRKNILNEQPQRASAQHWGIYIANIPPGWAKTWLQQQHCTGPSQHKVTALKNSSQNWWHHFTRAIAFVYLQSLFSLWQGNAWMTDFVMFFLFPQFLHINLQSFALFHYPLYVQFSCGHLCYSAHLLFHEAYFPFAATLAKE